MTVRGFPELFGIHLEMDDLRQIETRELPFDLQGFFIDERGQRSLPFRIGEFVDQFRLVDFPVDVQYAVFLFDLDSLESEILGQQRLQKDHAAGAVRQNMKELDTDAFPVIEHAHRAVGTQNDGDRLARNVLLFFNQGQHVGGFQIVPEEAVLDDGGKGRKAFDREVQCQLQKDGLDVLLQFSRKAKHRHLAILHAQGIDDRSVI